MMKVTAKGKFDTSFGTAFIVENVNGINVNDEIVIDNNIYKIASIILPSTPTIQNELTIVVK